MSGPVGQLRGRAARLVRLMPSGPSNAARTPFVLLVVVLLGGGLITLLVLNSALNEGSFRLSELKKRTTELTDEQQALQHDVDNYSKPDALERRARELGMVPGGSPAFLNPNGTVRGVPAETTAEPTPTPPPPKSSPPVAPAATASATTTPGATASTSAVGAPPPATVPVAPSPSGAASAASLGGPGAAAPPSTFAPPSAGAPTPADQPSTSPGR
ncbi:MULTISPECIES: septum formation initiator family protein [unclassified Streptomyces]|uniref:FtsB family cell division protein n=2 Tax=unclassified Streptomyces TaxID=2593676 RepID=UPI0037F1C9A8